MDPTQEQAIYNFVDAYGGQFPGPFRIYGRDTLINLILNAQPAEQATWLQRLWEEGPPANIEMGAQAIADYTGTPMDQITSGGTMAGAEGGQQTLTQSPVPPTVVNQAPGAGGGGGGVEAYPVPAEAAAAGLDPGYIPNQDPEGVYTRPTVGPAGTGPVDQFQNLIEQTPRPQQQQLDAGGVPNIEGIIGARPMPNDPLSAIGAGFNDTIDQIQSWLERQGINLPYRGTLRDAMGVPGPVPQRNLGEDIGDLFGNAPWAGGGNGDMPTTQEPMVDTTPPGIGQTPATDHTPVGEVPTQHEPIAAHEHQQGQQYVVQEGDSLWAIAEKLLGDGSAYMDIARANGINPDDYIHSGQQLYIPPNAPMPTERPGERGPSTGQYVVQRGDNLWDIAQRELGDGNRWREIAQANGLTTTTINPNDVLAIPGR